MATQKNCLSCKKEFWGNRNKVFCSDACRKYASRHPETKLNGFSGPDNTIETPKPIQNSPSLPVFGHGKSGQRRTIGHNLLEHLGKRTIDSWFGIGDFNAINKQAKPSDSSLSPMKMKSLENSLGFTTGFTLQSIINTPPLSPSMKCFLGEISLPFQILIWGLPGQGKSTFSLKLASELTKFAGVLLVAGEEDIESNTFIKRIGLTMDNESLKQVKAVSRLPINFEWISALDKSNGQTEIRVVVYDSINVLGLHPSHAKLLKENPLVRQRTTGLGHIYISQAQKDGKAYMGNAAWGHEVDVIIKVVEGKAIIEKNRFATHEFGKTGAEYAIF